MLVAVRQRDAGLLRSAVLEVATLRRHFDDDQLEQALARFMARYLAGGAAPSAAMFNDLLQLFYAFGINLPPEFSTFRALVTLEGTLTALSPGYLVIETAEQIAAEWARASLPRLRCRSWPARSWAAWPCCCGGPRGSWTASPPSSSGATSWPGCAVAGCAGLLWLLAGGVLPVPPLAAGRGVAADRYRPAGTGRWGGLIGWR
jgi:hypothetical protein